MALLEVRGLRAGYGGLPVLFGLDFEIEENETVALLGANGAGKTTTLRAVSGAIPTMGGTVIFDGHDVTPLRAERLARRGLVHIPEGRGLFPHLEVGETLELAARLAGLRGGEARNRIDEAYTMFPHLERRRRQAAGTLSGGEQQMLALARGLITRPRLLMIDEMSQGLAPTLVDQLFGAVQTFSDHGIALLLVEQHVQRALKVAKRAYVLESGELTYSGDAAELADDREFTRSSYLGNVSAEEISGNGRARANGDAEEVSLSIPAPLLRALEERAAREDVNVDELVRRAIAERAPRRERSGDGETKTRRRTARSRSTSRRRRPLRARREPTKGGRRDSS